MKWWWIVVALAAVAIGIAVGLRINLMPKTDEESDVPAFREVILGIPAQVPSVEQPWRATSRLTQKRRYTTTDLLALRVVSDELIEKQISLTVRLLQEDGSVQALTPSNITVSGGIGGYCCWTVTTPGIFKLQIFREGQTPFVLPLTIVKAPRGGKPLQVR